MGDFAQALLSADAKDRELGAGVHQHELKIPDLCIAAIKMGPVALPGSEDQK